MTRCIMRAVGAQSHQSIMALARKSTQARGTRSTRTIPSRAISNRSSGGASSSHTTSTRRPAARSRVTARVPPAGLAPSSHETPRSMSLSRRSDWRAADREDGQPHLRGLFQHACDPLQRRHRGNSTLTAAPRRGGLAPPIGRADSRTQPADRCSRHRDRQDAGGEAGLRRGPHRKFSTSIRSWCSGPIAPTLRSHRPARRTCPRPWLVEGGQRADLAGGCVQKLDRPRIRS